MYKYLGIIGFVIALGVGGLIYWVSESTTVAPTGISTSQRVAIAEKLVVEQRWEDLYRMMADLRADNQGELDQEWFRFEIQALDGLNSFPRLVEIYESHPELFTEAQVLRLCRYLMHIQAWDSVDAIMSAQGQWKDKKGWLFLEVDRLALLGKKKEAVAKLEKAQLGDEAEMDRLLRLAVLTADDNLQTAWNHLSEGMKIDAKNAALRTMRGRILERLSKSSLAHVEFRAAVLSDPDNPIYRDNLADFYRRYKQYRMAITTWGQGLTKEGSADYLWLRTWFWSRVAIPIVFEWDINGVPNGIHKPLISYLLSLKEGEFWSDRMFVKTPSMEFLLSSRQETYWLRILGYLQRGEDSEAYGLLHDNAFGQGSWAPDLEVALKQILSYRIDRNLPVIEEAKVTDSTHFLYTQLHAAAKSGEISEDLKSLLLSDYIFVAALLAEEWYQAALTMNPNPIVPKNMPVWMTYELTRAHESNISHEAALDFVQKQHDHPLIRLVEGELMVRTGKKAEAQEILEQLSLMPTSIGIRASIVLSSLYAEQSRFDEVEELVKRHEELDESLAGKEILAQIALAKGNVQKATRLFESIEKQSGVAQAYLVRKALQDKDYERAKDLTLRMLQSKPDSLELRAQLKQILEMQQGKDGAEVDYKSFEAIL